MNHVQIRLHPLSLLTGAGALALVLSLSGSSQVATGAVGLAQPVHGTVRPVFTQGLSLKIPGPITVEGIPTPGQMVRVAEGVPYVVPLGKTFVLTGIGTQTGALNIAVTARFDGADVLGALLDDAQVLSVPPGVAAGPGTAISIADSGSSASAVSVLLGYLADQ